MRWLALIVLAILLGGCTTGSVGARTPEPPAQTRSLPPRTPIPVRPSDWPTYHHDNQRTGAGDRTRSTGRLAVAWHATLDGAVYGQPLVIGGRILAATEQDTVYALDPADGHVLWSTRLGDPQPLADLPCGDIDPLGITGTAAYDPATGLVFVLAETRGGHHLLAGLDPATGAVALTRPLEPPRGDAGVHQQRAALTVLDGWVYVAFGGLYGDCGDYVGSVVAAPTSGLGAVRSFAVPTTKLGGIWAPGGGVLDNGRLLYPIGNGESTVDYDHSDGVSALTPELTLADSFSPEVWAADNADDLDLGSMSPAVVGGRVLAAGKRGVGYVLAADRLGGVGSQLWQGPVCRAYGGSTVVADPAGGGTVFVPCKDRTRAVAVDAAGQARVHWTAAVPADGSPVLGGGALWTTDTSGGTLYALDPATGAPLGSVGVGPLPHFASPTVAGDATYVGTLDGVVAVTG